MSIYALLRNKPQPTMEDITQALDGLLFPVSPVSGCFQSFLFVEGESEVRSNHGSVVLSSPSMDWNATALQTSRGRQSVEKPEDLKTHHEPFITFNQAEKCPETDGVKDPEISETSDQLLKPMGD